MKTHTFILVVLASLLFAQCKKETVTSMPDAKTNFLLQAQQFVQQKTSPADYGQLDWVRAKVYQQNGVNQMVRVPLLGKTHPWQRAVYLTYANGSFSGNYFELVNNTITTVSLDKERECVAPLSADGRLGGYRVYEKGQLIAQNTAMRNAVYIIRPPAYFSNLNFQMYYLIVMLGLGQGGVGGELSNVPQGIASYLGVPEDGGELGGSAGGEIIEVELDDSADKPAVDIKKLFKCFDEVPEVPAPTYSISLCADIPINSDPTQEATFPGFSPGHTFLIITKKNNSISITQAFGFYPVNGKSSIRPNSPGVPSKIVDDANHEINASITIENLDPFLFRQIRANAEDVLSKNPYSLEYNNCSDFAIDLFNLTRNTNNKIVVSSFNVIEPTPVGPVSYSVLKSPQALFFTLKALKESGGPDAPNIKIVQNNSYQGPQTRGECN